MKIKPSPALLAVILPLVLLVPYLPKAFHIDDPVYLWVAQHLHTSPLDFYGFVINWYGFEQFAHEVNQNPPLVSYFAALGAVLFGWSEPSVHLWLLIPALLLSLGIARLAGQLSLPQTPAVLVAVLTPLYLISATSIMSDVSMCALYVWSVYLWLHGLSHDKHRYLLLAAVLMAFAVMTKYFAFSVVPLLLVFTLWKKRAPSMGLLYLFIPIGALLSYEYISYSLYGHGLVWNAAKYALDLGGGIAPRLQRLASAFAFVGGCLISLVFVSQFLFTGKQFIGFVATVALLSVSIGLSGAALSPLFPFVTNMPWNLVLQYSLFLCLGGALIALAVVDFIKARDDASVLIIMWVLGTFAFMAFINWSVSARNVLPMLTPLALLVARRFPADFRIANYSSVPSYALLFVPALVLSIAFVKTDVAEANSQREAADQIALRTLEYQGPVWFFGHWGFQYYMQQYGKKPYTNEKTQFQTGDIIVLPTGNTNVDVKFSEEYFWHIDQLQAEARWLNVMQVNAGAGFYSNWRGPMPLNFHWARPDEYHVFVYGKFTEAAEALSHARSNGYQFP